MQYKVGLNNESIADNVVMLMQLADEMAAAATTFSGQGYSSFLQARETFKDTLEKTLSNN
jgi:hypothetical protein